VKIVRTASHAARLRAGTARPLVIVPTMGALHAGHLSLVRKARQLAGSRGAVAVSIFVNPAQFGPKEDFSCYPRPLSRDLRLCREVGVDFVFHPSVAAMYPGGYSTYVDEERLSLPLCGASRPGHFRGVCTVVLKLFNLLAPDIAVFGEKDYQQVAVIRRMVRDLNVPVRIVTAPTLREPDGLALSSRNAYLTPVERAQAPVIRHALLLAGAAPYRRPADLERLVRREIATTHLARIDYVHVLDADTLEKPGPATRALVIACAVFFGKTRLIDNITRKAESL
jgi:pantoate--beta-alanine ligase